MKLVDRSIHVNAPASILYELLTDPVHFVRWMSEAAEIDARPDGEIRWTHANGDTCSGRFVELVPDRRLVFTYGWERAEVEIPPGSTRVEIDLRPNATGTTVHLIHRGLSGPMADAHNGGWSHYLHRLATAAEGRDPGPDAFANQRVPTPIELGMR